MNDATLGSSGQPGRESDHYQDESQDARQPGLRVRRLVLVAEDDEPLAGALALIIEDAGYTPLRAADGRAALELARARRPGLVMTDLMMPYMTGAELIVALRSDAQASGTSGPPIILITAASYQYARDLGADAVVQKPFDLEEIESLLHRYLGPPPSIEGTRSARGR